VLPSRYLAICFTEHANNSNAAPRGNNIQSLIQQLVRSLVRITNEEDCPPAAWMLLSELSHSIAVSLFLVVIRCIFMFRSIRLVLKKRGDDCNSAAQTTEFQSILQRLLRTVVIL
jgi:hypothetical protein